jgi:hypothetical protein
VSAFTGKFFVLHAGREQSDNAPGLENAPGLATESSEAKAREDSHWFSDAVWWEYDVFNGRVLGRFPRWDIWVRRGPGSFRRAK